MDMKHNPEGGRGRACSHCSLRHAEIAGPPRKVSSREGGTGLFDFFHGKRKHAVHFGLLLGTAQGDMRAALFFSRVPTFQLWIWTSVGIPRLLLLWAVLRSTESCVYLCACVLLLDRFLKVKFVHWRGYACLVSVNIAGPLSLEVGLVVSPTPNTMSSETSASFMDEDGVALWRPSQMISSRVKCASLSVWKPWDFLHCELLEQTLLLIFFFIELLIFLSDL